MTEPVHARPGRVLVIDDDALVGRAVARSLRNDHDVTVVTSAREALKRIVAGERFDVLLSDIVMPEMNGVEFHRELARVEPEQASRVTFVSGGGFALDVEAYLDMLPNQRIAKPVDLQWLRVFVAARVG